MFFSLPCAEKIFDKVIRLKPIFWAEIIVMITIYCSVFRYAYLLQTDITYGMLADLYIDAN